MSRVKISFLERFQYIRQMLQHDTLVWGAAVAYDIDGAVTVAAAAAVVRHLRISDERYLESLFLVMII